MADYLLSSSADPVTGEVVWDRVITPSGDWAMVSGPQLVGQNVLLFLTTGLGQHPTNPLFGSEFVADIGQPAPDSSAYDVALAECTAYFQAQDAQNPQTPLDEQIDHIGDVQVLHDTSGAIGVVPIFFTVYTRSGASQVVTTT